MDYRSPPRRMLSDTDSAAILVATVSVSHKLFVILQSCFGLHTCHLLESIDQPPTLQRSVVVPISRTVWCRDSDLNFASGRAVVDSFDIPAYLCKDILQSEKQAMINCSFSLPGGSPPRICSLSGPVLRDTARLSQRYPSIARYGVFGVLTWPIGCDTPSPFSERFPL